MANQEGTNKRKRAQNKEREMASKIDKNPFASAWNGSDMVLVVEGQELHVHKSILTLQSLVFKAMLDGHFREASQGKITLKQKDSQSMIQFLKFLYPSSLFPECKVPLNNKDRLSVMALADEYQCEYLMKECIDEAKITTKNVLKILPYAVKYHHTALVQMFSVIKSGIQTSRIENFLPEIENKETSTNLLLTKCQWLESTAVQMHDTIISLLRDILIQKKFAADVRTALSDALAQITILEELKDRDDMSDYIRNYPWCTAPYNFNPSRLKMVSQMETAADSKCDHTVEVGEIRKIKSCVICKRKYREKFIAPISAHRNPKKFLKLLQGGDDIANAVDPHRASNDS